MRRKVAGLGGGGNWSTLAPILHPRARWGRAPGAAANFGEGETMERDETQERERERQTPRPQDGSTKVHGDKLDPVIPRGADQKDDAEQRDDSDRGTEGT